MDYLLGGVVLFPYEFAPKGWLACEGQTLPIMQNQALFSLLGTKFGGDGRTTFTVPNLKGKEPLPGLHYCIALNGSYPTRD